MKTKENNNSFIRSSVLSKKQRSTTKKKPNTTLYFASSTNTFPSLKHSVTPQKKVIKYLNISSESISNTNNKRLNSLINNYRKPTQTEPNHSLSKTTLINKKTYSKITKKPLNRSTIINNKDYLDKKKMKTLKSNQNKNGNNVTITTSASNSNTFQKKYHEIIENIEGKFFGVVISNNEQTELNEFINQLSKKMDLNIVYISKDQLNGDYERTINKFYINNLFNFVLYEQSYELLKKYSHKDFILYDRKEKPLYSLCFEHTTNKTIILNEISNIIHNKTSITNTTEKIEKFLLSFFEKNLNHSNNLLLNDLILLYFPELIQKKEEQLRNDSMIIELYTFTNLYDKKIEVISISNNKNLYPWINYKLDNEMKNKLTNIPIKNPLLVFDHNYRLISSSGIKDILQNSYQSYRYWMNCGNVLNSFPNNDNLSSLNYTDHEDNSIQNIPNRQFILFNFFSSNISECIINELSSIYNCLKHKILFLHINYNEITSTNIEKVHPFKFGLYPSFDSEYLSSLFMKIQLNRTQRENPFLFILSNDEIITYISYSSIKNSIYPLFNKWLSPYNCIHNKTVLYSFLSPIEKLITPQKSKISINDVNQFDLILLYFNELSNQKKYTNILNELNIKVNSDKRNKVLIIFIPYDKSVSLKTLQNANKDINFYQCEYNNINELYKRYNPMKIFPTMTLIDRFGLINNDNATSQIENQGEMYFKNIFEQLGIDYLKEPILIHLSFLGDEFEYEGRRISRKNFNMKCKYVGLLFLSSWCIISESFTKEIDEINEKNKIIEIILNNIEEDKSIFNQYNKAMKYISIPYDYRIRLMDLFNIISIGVPSLFLFDIDNGNYIHYFDMDNINTLKDFIL